MPAPQTEPLEGGPRAFARGPEQSTGNSVDCARERVSTDKEEHCDSVGPSSWE